MKLDYSIKDLASRQAAIDQLLITNPNPTPKELEAMANYLVYCLSPEEKKDKTILTENRKSTINKRETSYEGLSEKFENGEDGIYGIVTNDKNTIFRHKMKISEEDIKLYPEVRQAVEAAKFWEEKLKTAPPEDKSKIQKALIEARQNQYTVRAQVNPPCGRGGNKTKNAKYAYRVSLEGHVTFDQEGYCVPHGITLVDPQICQAILHNLNSLPTTPDDSDLWYLVDEFKETMHRALANEPTFAAIVEDKLYSMQNVEIQKDLLERFGTTHSLEYISSLWCKKIPKLIASQAEDDYLDWYYTNVERGKWKKCSRCGKIKLAHNKYFSRNTTSKDNFYSICKECRNKPNQGLIIPEEE